MTKSARRRFLIAATAPRPSVNVDMPAMTMVFRVKDPAMLDQVKESDKIKFSADHLHAPGPIDLDQSANGASW